MTERNKALLLVFSLALLAHLPALSAGYVLDDRLLLVENPFLRSISGLGQLLTNEFFRASAEMRNVPYYRPLSGLFYWLSYQLLGTHSVLQHALNLLLHGLVCVLLYRVMTSARVRPRWAVGCSALLAVHPASPDIVAYIGGRQDMLGWSLVLLGWLLLKRWRERPMLTGVTAAITVLCAALAREFFLVAPLLLIPVAWHSVPGGRVTRRMWHAVVVAAGGAVGVGAALLLRRLLSIQSFVLEPPGPIELVQTVAGLALRLLKLCFWPFDVSVNITLELPPILESLLVLLGLLVACGLSVRVVLRRGGSTSVVALGWVTFFSVLVMHVPVALKYGVVSDRYGYGAILGLVCVLASTGQLLTQAWQVPLRPTLQAAMPWVFMLAVLPSTWARAAEWRDEASLQAAMYRARPQDPQSQLAEGMRRFTAGDLDGAFPLCLAYSQAPTSQDAAGFCLGTVYLLRGQPVEAARALEPFAVARPGQLSSRIRLFQAWFAANDLEGVRRGLAYFGPLWPDAPDLKEASLELERRAR